MMGNLWDVFCGESDCKDPDGGACTPNSLSLGHPFTCINHLLVICFNIVLLVLLLFNMTQKSSSKLVRGPSRYLRFSRLKIASAIVNGFVGLIYLGLGIWILEEKLRRMQTALPLNRWLAAVFQGFTWLLIGFIGSLRIRDLPKMPLRLLAILAFLFAGVLCILSVLTAVTSKEVSVRRALDILSILGASLFLFCAHEGHEVPDKDNASNGGDLYTPLTGEANDSGKADAVVRVTPFAKAGFFSRMSFWWLNSLMKRGREKTLKEEDVPKLREADRAENCYASFLEQLNRQKIADPSSQPSILRTIILCQWREIIISGFFALLKILTLSAGPLLLNAFIEVAQGIESFEY